MAGLDLPRVGTPLTQGGDTVTRPYYTFFQATAAALVTQTNVTVSLAAIEKKINSLSGNWILNGLDSINLAGSPSSGLIVLSLQGDVNIAGNTSYYGSNTTGTKGWYTVASAFHGTTGNITLTTAGTGITTVDLAAVTDVGGGTLQKTAFDAYGRKTGTSAATTSNLSEGTNLYFTDARARAAVGSSGSGEALVADGISAPPVMLTNEAQDDFLFSG
jgi:hypothetical protein